jgi:hypothetical protein
MLFAAQSIDFCWNGNPPQFVNPLTLWYGDLMFVASILVTLAAWIFFWSSKRLNENRE